MLVVMGFTGAAAMLIKVKYIQAFNWMADQLTRWHEMAAHYLCVNPLGLAHQ
ncbi:Rha family transcriptional regulator [Klebsiella pneumoniae]|uniref:Rha family transcriptional regulator n=1 Tax=Klebsiella pneumoniae TaxID=573 RepID=UPI003570E6E9